MKKKYLSLLIPGIISWFSIIILFKLEASAQLIPDNTLGSERSIVVPLDASNDLIEGGAQRGSNLFQSFSEFNVGEGRGVTFANPPGVENILNRVTGGNPSNIFGRLGVAGNANLFLINPAGIIFGPNAILDVSGSFTATTADGFQLGEGGFFSATNILGSSLLSVSPSALFFNQVAVQQTGNITVNSSFNNLSGDSNLTLLSTNNIFIENPLNLQAGTGNIDLKADVDGNLTGDFIVTNTANTIATNGRDITITGVNIILGDIDGASDTDTGDITLNASGNISTGNLSSDLYSGLYGDNTGDGGAITLEADGDITTGNLSSYTYSYDLNSGDGGAITLEADGDINTGNLDSRSYAGNNTGDGGAITLEADGDINTGNIDSLTFSYFSGSVAGNGGSINLTAEGDINTGGFVDSRSTTTSGIATDGGAITLEAGGDINPSNIDSSSVSGISNENTGNAGSISILSGNNINLTNGNVLANGQTAGNITLESSGNISLEGTTIQSINSGVGSGGNIEITTSSLILTNNSGIEVFTGEGGVLIDILINATDSVTIDESIVSTIFATPLTTPVEAPNIIPEDMGDSVDPIPPSVEGNSGNIIIMTSQLSVLNGGQIIASTFGTGNAGDINIIGAESIVLDGFGFSFGFGDTLQLSGLFSASIDGSTGNGGNIVIDTDSIIVSNQAQINTNTEETGNAGNITIDATESISIETGNISSAVLDGSGNAGDINLNVSEGNLSLTNGGQIIVNTEGDGNAGNANITAESIVLDGTGTILNFNDETGIVEENVVNSGIFSESLGENTKGDGGIIEINTGSLTVNNEGIISVVNEGEGDGGNININSSENIQVNNGAILSNSTGDGAAGDITLTATQDINSINSTVNATSETGGGNINFTANNIELENINFGTEVFNATGGGGNIIIIADVFTALGNSNFSASAIEGEGGNIVINADAFLVDQAVSIDATAGIEISGKLSFILEVDADSKLTNSQQILSNSCLARKGRQRNSFTVTGVDTLPVLPYQRQIGQFRVTDVSDIGNQNTITSPIENQPTTAQWKIGDAVEEAGGIIISDSGKIMLGSMEQVTKIAKADDLICNYIE